MLLVTRLCRITHLPHTLTARNLLGFVSPARSTALHYLPKHSSHNIPCNTLVSSLVHMMTLEIWCAILTSQAHSIYNTASGRLIVRRILRTSRVIRNVSEDLLTTYGYRSRVRKSRYWGEMLLSPIHCCDVTKPPSLLSDELCTSPLYSNCLYVYTVCCRRGGQCISVLRTRHTNVVGDSSGRSYVTEQGHIVPLLRTRDIDIVCIEKGI